MRVVYGATRALYKFLPMAIGSLLRTNPGMKIVLICEDDEIETCKHSNIEFINIHKLPTYFNEESPNYNTHWTYMSLIRVVLAKILPNDDRVLWLDVDTLVLENLSSLEQFDMSESAYAAVPELPCANHDVLDFKGEYTNSGVCVLNLDYIRKHKLDDRMIELLNTQELPFPDQDALNYICGETASYLPSWYNVSLVTPRVKMRNYIIHFTYKKLWDDPNVRLWNEFYRENLDNI